MADLPPQAVIVLLHLSHPLHEPYIPPLLRTLMLLPQLIVLHFAMLDNAAAKR